MIFTEQPGKKDHIVEQLHHDDNSAVHLKSLIETITAITPAFTHLLELVLGAEKGCFDYLLKMYEAMINRLLGGNADSIK